MNADSSDEDEHHVSTVNVGLNWVVILGNISSFNVKNRCWKHVYFNQNYVEVYETYSQLIIIIIYFLSSAIKKIQNNISMRFTIKTMNIIYKARIQIQKFIKICNFTVE